MRVSLTCLGLSAVLTLAACLHQDDEASVSDTSALPLQTPLQVGQAPIVLVGDTIHVGADVAPLADALPHAATHGDARVSHGPVQDGIGAAELIAYLEADSRPPQSGEEDGMPADTIIEVPLLRFSISPPTVHVADGTPPRWSTRRFARSRRSTPPCRRTGSSASARTRRPPARLNPRTATSWSRSRRRGIGRRMPCHWTARTSGWRTRSIRSSRPGTRRRRSESRSWQGGSLWTTPKPQGSSGSASSRTNSFTCSAGATWTRSAFRERSRWRAAARSCRTTSCTRSTAKPCSRSTGGSSPEPCRATSRPSWAIGPTPPCTCAARWTSRAARYRSAPRSGTDWRSPGRRGRRLMPPLKTTPNSPAA